MGNVSDAMKKHQAEQAAKAAERMRKEKEQGKPKGGGA